MTILKPRANVAVDSTVLQWLERHAIQKISVVSPHLDDAVFSTAGLLQSTVGVQFKIFTVFTEASPGADPAWAIATGFHSVEQELQARREEDRKAMEHMSAISQHVGASASTWDSKQAIALAQCILQDADANVPMLVLLPAAAGGPTPGKLRALFKKLIRQPFGAPVHQEHKIVRDDMIQAFLNICGRNSVFVGFYAEIPYIWSDAPSRLNRLLQQSIGTQLETYTLLPNQQDKLLAASYYASQLGPILGDNCDYRLRVLGGCEYYFLSDQPMKK